MAAVPTFYVVPGSTVKSVIDEHRKQVFDVVEAAYRLHASGDTINPDSYFLRYPDNPGARIIALPAHLGGAIQKSGIKWISSFPENRAGNLARASAVLILNDAVTGYPLACIEASLISATRTAASAALAAEHISPNPFGGNLSVIGTGVIARTTVEWLLFRGWKFRKISLYDVDRKEMEHFSKWLRDQHSLQADIQVCLDDAICDSTGNKDFVSGTLVDVLEKKVKLDNRTRIFSPFGLGVLDLAVGNFVLSAAIASNAAIALPDFFSNSARW